ncbi:MAG: glycosyltransferase, partial [Bacteroidia bacterium]|nr:glycosyltransferase [Bacteroidia bacterium]
HDPKVSFIQKLPRAKDKHQYYLPIFPYAIEKFDLSEYDLILSSSHAVSKGVLTNANQIHVCYCHTPMRYAWDLYHQYLKLTGLNTGIKSLFVKHTLNRLRNWDQLSSQRVDYFVANSYYVGKRIKKNYGRDSHVIYPPVDIDKFNLQEEKKDYYMTMSRMVPYKRMDLVVEAFSKMPDKKLIVIGDGPDFKKIQNLTKGCDNITMLGYQPNETVKKYMEGAKAFVFAADEDFGITSIEAQACGTPVITYGKGGSLETVINNKTGRYFKEQTVEEIVDAVRGFEKEGIEFTPAQIREHATNFDRHRFRYLFKEYVDEVTQKHEVGSVQQA